ncbi:hypothetical protein ACOSP7_025241 [Xanthoceras sorbifolium]
MPNMIINKPVVEWTQAISKEDKRFIGGNLLISRKPPDVGWVKLNVDGGRDNDSGIIYVGGVIRDNSRKWVNGFAMNIGYGSVLEAKLRAMCEGLKIVWNVGHRSAHGN